MTFESILDQKFAEVDTLLPKKEKRQLGFVQEAMRIAVAMKVGIAISIGAARAAEIASHIIAEKLNERQTAAKTEFEKQLANEELFWAESAMNDAEYGGDKWEASQDIIAVGRDHLATPGAVELINLLGVGNHPELLRMFYRAGKLLSTTSNGEDR